MAEFYHSTRSSEKCISSKQAILDGIAPDGGLYVSDQLCSSSVDLAQLCSQNYQATARDVMGLLLPDFTDEEIAACGAGA